MSNVPILLQKRRDLDCMYVKRSCEFFRIHILFTTPFEHPASQKYRSPALTTDRIDANNLNKCFMEHLADPTT
jgi:hypothetical protein